MNFTVSKIWAFSTASFFNTILKPKKNLFVKVSWDSTTCILLEKLWNFFCLNFIFQKCHKCKTLIKVNGQSYRGKLFHEECFTCHACRGSLTGMLCCFWTISFKRFSVSSVRREIQNFIFILGQKFHEDDGRYFHEGKCYQDFDAYVCDGCKSQIDGNDIEFMLFQGKYFHNRCFACQQCRQGLIGQKFKMMQGQKYCNRCRWWKLK